MSWFCSINSVFCQIMKQIFIFFTAPLAGSGSGQGGTPRHHLLGRQADPHVLPLPRAAGTARPTSSGSHVVISQLSGAGLFVDSGDIPIQMNARRPARAAIH